MGAYLYKLHSKLVIRRLKVGLSADERILFRVIEFVFNANWLIDDMLFTITDNCDEENENPVFWFAVFLIGVLLIMCGVMARRDK